VRLGALLSTGHRARRGGRSRRMTLVVAFDREADGR
jgi:hypothetical protein